MGGFYIVRRKRTVGSSSLVVPPARAQAPLLIIPGYEELDPRELEYLIEAFEERREERRRKAGTWRLDRAKERE